MVSCQLSHIWHTICTNETMQRSDPQHPLKFSSALSIDNTKQAMLTQSNTPYVFSDATDHSATSQMQTELDRTNPKHLIAFMVQTRRLCRSDGLIPRDRRELIEIGYCSGIACKTTNRIIDLMLECEPRMSLSRDQIERIDSLPIEHTNKIKTRHSVRVFIGLAIWALTIALAMQMV